MAKRKCWKQGYILKIYDSEGNIFEEKRDYSKRKLNKYITSFKKDTEMPYLKEVASSKEAYKEGGGYKFLRTSFNVCKK